MTEKSRASLKPRPVDPAIDGLPLVDEGFSIGAVFSTMCNELRREMAAGSSPVDVGLKFRNVVLTRRGFLIMSKGEETTIEVSLATRLFAEEVQDE